MAGVKRADLNRNLRMLLRNETGRPFFFLNEALLSSVSQENAFFSKEIARLSKMAFFEKSTLESFGNCNTITVGEHNPPNMPDMHGLPDMPGVPDISGVPDTPVVAGVDEAGRGPLAGPVVAAAVILPPCSALPGVNDSKQLSPGEREELSEELAAIAHYGIGVIGPEQIDEVNILQATYLAMQQAVAKLKLRPQFILADAVTIPNLNIPQKGIIKGDCLCISIAAASIMAKVARDRIMAAYDRIYPQYGFAHNQGYGTKEHLAALERYGPCPIHRVSFCRNYLPDTQKNA